MAHLQDFDPETGELALPNGTAARAMASPKPMAVPTSHRWLMQAMEKAVAAMPEWIKAESNVKVGGGGNAKYAKLHAILKEVRPHLLANGLRIRQGTDRTYAMDEGGGSKGRLVVVYTDIVHSQSGEVERTVVEIPLARLDPQGMGSAITYGRRYSLLMALGLATDEADDDGDRGKRADIAAPVARSSDEADLITEIKAAKTLADLTKWVSDAKTRKRIDGLDDAATERVRAAYGDRRESFDQ